MRTLFLKELFLCEFNFYFKMKTLSFILAAFCSFNFFAQEPIFTQEDIAISKFVDGTLLKPNEGSKNLAIIIADSGPIDRDGNQDFQKTNNLKKLAVALTNHGISTFRYDKRIIKQIRRRNLDPTIKFDDFINDAKEVIDYFKNQHAYDKIYVIGHSQGSLIVMVAAKDRADAFISLNGSAQTIDNVILKQVELTAHMFTEDTQRVFSILKEGKTTKKYPTALASFFDISVQPFMASWMQYSPVEELKKLDIPVLILNSTKDLQVSKEEAEALNAAGKHSELKLIDKMNHVLFIIEGNDQENAKSYNDHAGKVSEELIKDILAFINKN